MNISVCTKNPLIDEDLLLFANTLSRDDELLGERLQILSDTLKEMGY